LGYKPLYSNSNGYGNTAVGSGALSGNGAGASNTAVGDGANVNSGGHLFSSAFGESAIITGDYQVMIGSNYILSIGGYANWTNVSDGRVKKNIRQNVPGLAFINKLQPVTYNLDLDAADQIVQPPVMKDRDGKFIQPSAQQLEARQAKQRIVYSGFVAQDVQKAAKDLNYDFSGVDAAQNEHDLYGLRYSDFVVPLVKAVQELSAKNDEQQKINQDLQQEINELKAMIEMQQSSTSANSQIANTISETLEQNIPNPFNKSSIIHYYIPSTAINAMIVITDASGKTIKQFNNLTKGNGAITVEASLLASGSYLYTLVVDGKTIKTKQMILRK